MKLHRFSGPALPVLLVFVLLFSSCRTVVLDDPAPVANTEAEAETVTVSSGKDRVEYPKDDFTPLTPLPLENVSPNVTLPSRAGIAPVDVRDGSLPYSLAQDLTKDLESPDDLLPVEFAFDAEEIATVVDMFSYLLGEELTEEEIAERQAELDAVADLPRDPDNPDAEFADEEFEVPNVRPFAYYMDAGVGGAVTMTMDTEMTRAEAWELFQYILWLSGAYASRQKGFINILPFAKMPQERRLLHKFPDPVPNVAVELVRLYHLTPSEMSGMIQPYMTEGSVATPIQHLNALLLVEAPDNIVKIRELIGQLDIIGETQWPQISIGCRHVEVGMVVEELQQILPVLGFGTVTSDKGDGRSLKLIGLERMQVLIASAPTTDVLDEIKRWVAILDRADTVQQQEQIYFYPVKYNKAEDLADGIGVFFTQTSSAASAGSSRNSSSSTPTVGNRSSTSATSSTGRSAASTRRTLSTSGRRSGSTEKPETIFDVPVTIFADGTHNRLIIRTTPQAYAMLEALLLRLDTPPRQVLVQVAIAEITLTKETQFGFRYAAFNRVNEYGVLTGFGKQGNLASENDFSPFTTFRFTSPGVTDETGLDSAGDAFSFIQAIAGKKNSRIVSAPQIVAISDHEATISDGISVPISTTSFNNNTSANQPYTNVQYQDTGVILTVTPHITANNLVTLDLTQEVSSTGATGASGNPEISNKSLQTSLVVTEGETVLLGGHIQNKVTNGEFGIPYVDRVPVLGSLLTSRLRSNKRTELLLMITVHVLDVETDIEKLISDYEASIEAINSDLDAPKE